MAAGRRIAALRELLIEKDVDFWLCTHTSDIRWLTGFERVFDSEQAHVVLVSEDIAFLHSDTRYGQSLRERDTAGLWEISDEAARHPECIAQRLVDNASTAQRVIRIGLETDVRLDHFRALRKALDERLGQDGYELVELSDVVANLRAVKDDDEIAAIRKAQEFTDAAYTYMLEWLQVGRSEREAALELEYTLRSLGADGVAFPSIVASGPNSAVPHAVPTDRRFEQGDFVLMDFGARYLDYCADMTRTVVIGSASEQQRQIHAAVLEAQKVVKVQLRAGKTGEELHRLAADVIAAAGFPKAFIHSLGHGVGIDIHELPALAPRVTQTLVSGNVVTIEPGVYLPGIGGVRIEDFGLVTNEGFVDFTKSSHELLEL
ncbi:MAG: aminopeptidase P family protein [Coriobacteriaceae bacterium]|nr:aminopeptidase P family protein [Coriobacteriaceae bacterium]